MSKFLPISGFKQIEGTPLFSNPFHTAAPSPTVPSAPLVIDASSVEQTVTQTNEQTTIVVIGSQGPAVVPTALPPAGAGFTPAPVGPTTASFSSTPDLATLQVQAEFDALRLGFSPSGIELDPRVDPTRVPESLRGFFSIPKIDLSSIEQTVSQSNDQFLSLAIGDGRQALQSVMPVFGGGGGGGGGGAPAAACPQDDCFECEPTFDELIRDQDDDDHHHHHHHGQRRGCRSCR